jgi:hypothetical protein
VFSKIVSGNFSKTFLVCPGANDTACDQQDVPKAAGPTATPTPDSTPTPGSPTPSPQPTSSPTPVPTGSPTPVATGSPTPIATGSPTPRPTGSPTPVPTATPTPDPTPTPVHPPYVAGEFCTYNEAHWANDISQDILDKYFDSVYGATGGVQVGLDCSADRFSMLFTSANAVERYLPAGGKAGLLNACLADPVSSHSGNLGGEVLTLKLNVDFSAAGITEGSGGPFGSLHLCGSGTSLDGMTVAEILGAANKAVGNGGMPPGLNPDSLHNILHQLNLSFDKCHPHGFAQRHLTGAACR